MRSKFECSCEKAKNKSAIVIGYVNFVTLKKETVKWLSTDSGLINVDVYDLHFQLKVSANPHLPQKFLKNREVYDLGFIPESTLLPGITISSHPDYIALDIFDIITSRIKSLNCHICEKKVVTHEMMKDLKKMYKFSSDPDKDCFNYLYSTVE